MSEENIPPQTTEGAGKSGKKLWIIIGAVIIVIILVSVVSGSFGKGAAERALENAGVDVDYNRDGSATYTSDDGSVTVGTNASYPDSWPSDAPKYPGAEILFSGSSNPQTGSAGASLSFTTKDGAAKVIEFYKSELVKAGWAVENTANAGGAMMLSATKDERTFGIWATSADGTTQVTVGLEM